MAKVSNFDAWPGRGGGTHLPPYAKSLLKREEEENEKETLYLAPQSSCDIEMEKSRSAAPSFARTDFTFVCVWPCFVLCETLARSAGNDFFQEIPSLPFLMHK